MTEARVSVVIPVGPGHARHAAVARASVEWQTVAALPILSFDQEGKGAGWARNRGIEQVQTELTLFLDADDYLLPTAIEELLTAYDATGRYTYGDWYEYEGTDYTRRYSRDYDQRGWFDGPALHPITVLCPTQWLRTIGSFDEQMPGWEMWDLWCKFATRGYCGQRAAVPTFVYRTREGGRRQIAEQHGTALRALLRERYGEYTNGAKTMACCGGSSGKASFMAQRIDIQAGGPAVGDDGLVEMTFTGDEPGSLHFKNPKNGRSYRGSAGVVRDGIRTGGHRFARVHPDDVDFLLATGKWRTSTPAKVVPPQPPPLVPDASVLELVAAAQGDVNVYVPNTSARRRYDALLTTVAPPGDPKHVDIQAHLPTLYDLVPKDGVVLELGTRTGFSTSAFLTAVEEKGGHVYSVDIKARWGKMFDGHPQWTFIYGNSTDQPAIDAGGLNGQPIDVLLIDSDHSYAHVTYEITTWAHRVKQGGVILFHDTDQDGVRRAVNELIAYTHWAVEEHDGSHGLAVVHVEGDIFTNVGMPTKPPVRSNAEPEPGSKGVQEAKPEEKPEPRRRGRQSRNRDD